MFDYLASLRHRIVGRMLLWVVLPTILIFAAIVSLSMRERFRSLREAAELRLQLQTRLIAAQLEEHNRGAVISVQRMAEAQVAGLFGNREASLEYARRVLQDFPGITGSYFGYEPNADGKDAESLGKLPAEGMDPKGRFIPYWYIDTAGSGEIKLQPLVDMETSLYYNGAKQDFLRTGKPAAKVTEPYVYEGKMITEQVFPIVIDGEFKGVAGVDFALADIDKKLRRLAQEENLDIFLISSGDKFIAATTDPLSDANLAAAGSRKTKHVDDVPDNELFRQLLRERNSGKPILATDPVDDLNYYFAAAPIPTGNWVVVAREEERDVLAPIWAEIAAQLALVLTGLAAVIALLVAMTLKLSRRINRAAEVAERVAAGNLADEVGVVDYSDETGVLLRSISKMTCNLNSLVGDVKRASIQLNSTAMELSATSRQQEETVNSFGASSSEIAAATRQISATNAELLNTMREVSRTASETAQTATAGRSSLVDMEGSMRHLDSATGSIGAKLAAINEKAASITGIVTTINRVADQTNVLSLNAAIQAEKAGEYGLGFMVVAREIRRLADQTAAATLDIEQTVKQMLSAVSAGVMEMDRFTDQVRRNVREAAAINHRMGEIIEQVNSNSQRFESVSESMRSQAEGADQISQAMAQLTGGAAESSAAIRTYAEAANELRTAIDSLRSAVAIFHLR